MPTPSLRTNATHRFPPRCTNRLERSAANGTGGRGKGSEEIDYEDKDDGDDDDDDDDENDDDGRDSDMEAASFLLAAPTKAVASWTVDADVDADADAARRTLPVPADSRSADVSRAAKAAAAAVAAAILYAMLVVAATERFAPLAPPTPASAASAPASASASASALALATASGACNASVRFVYPYTEEVPSYPGVRAEVGGFLPSFFKASGDGDGDGDGDGSGGGGALAATAVTLYVNGLSAGTRTSPPYEWGSCSSSSSSFSSSRSSTDDGTGGGGNIVDDHNSPLFPMDQRWEPGTYVLRVEAHGHADLCSRPPSAYAAAAEITVTVPHPSSFRSGYDPYDEAYVSALDEIERNIQCGRFIAGNGWTQLWTRDTSYAIDLMLGGIGIGGGGKKAGAGAYSEVVRSSLEACVERDEGGGITGEGKGEGEGKGKGNEEYSKDSSSPGRIVWLQDECGHFGGWPNLTDAVVGVLGSWSYYLASGNQTFLKWAYDVTKSSLIRAERDAYDNYTGLFQGCSSFMESNSGYPSKYAFNGNLVRKTKALSTNMLHYVAYTLGSDMGTELGAPAQEIASLQRKAKSLRESIRSGLWSSSRGRYAYFQDENGRLVPHEEGLGTALALLAPGFEPDPRRVDSILRSVHRERYGVPCLWPRFDIRESVRDIATYYHNGRIWPFVSGYFAVAAARRGSDGNDIGGDDNDNDNDKDDNRHKVRNLAEEYFADEFDALVALHGVADTFAEFYELNGTFPPVRRRQLWSDAGYMGMVHRGLFGMELGIDGLRFRPCKPRPWSRPRPVGTDSGGAVKGGRGGGREGSTTFGETVSLRNLRYRGMTLDIYVTGTGTEVKTFELDGEMKEDEFVPNDLVGNHVVRIVLRGEWKKE